MNSTERFVNVTEKFRESYELLPLNIQKKVNASLLKFKSGFKSKGLHIENLQKDLWSFRVDRSYRVVFRKASEDDTPELLYVGKHDDAYRFSDIELRRLRDHNPKSRFRRHSNQKTYVMRDIDELIEFTQRKNKHFMLKMPEEYQYLIKEDFNKNMIIRGVSGSGKTTLLVYRALNFVRRNSGKKVLFITYNKSLKNFLNKMFDDLCTKEEHRDAIEVINIDKWLFDVFEFIPTDLGRFTLENLLDFIDMPVEQKIPVDKPTLQREIEESIVGNLNLTLEEYLKAPCFFEPLTEEQKQFIFQVFLKLKERFVDKAVSKYELEYSWVKYLSALEMLKRGDKDFPVYHHIFIDEAQDMYPIQFELLKHFVDRNGGITIAGSISQSIYNSGFKWEKIADMLNALTHTLGITFRNTDSIGSLLEGVLKNIRDIDGEDFIKPRYFYTSEHEPVVKGFGSLEEEGTFIAGEIKRLDIPLENVAVLLPTRKLIDKFKELITEEGIPAVTPEDPSFFSPDHLNIITYHSSKGLEFRAVFAAGFNKEEIEELALQSYGSNKEMMYKLIHVALTRALDRLYVTWHGDRSPYLELLE